MAPPVVSVVGIGKLGSCLAAITASRGVHTIAVDANVDAIHLLRQKTAPVREPGLQDMITCNHDFIEVADSILHAVAHSSITFVVVPSVPETSGVYSLSAPLEVMRSIGQALKSKHAYHLVVLVSTVLPGSCRCVLVPELEKSAGDRCGRAFGFCYNPAFVALGEVIENFLNPDMILIGQADQASGNVLEQFYQFMQLQAPVYRMALDNAEVTKLALNSFITTKISFVNTLASMCELIPGGDIDVVTAALGADTRIGRKCLAGGLGFGGPCLPKDNTAVSALAAILGIAAPLPMAVDEINHNVPDRVALIVEQFSEKTEAIGILGISYKVGSHILVDSQAMSLLQTFQRRFKRVLVFDKLATLPSDIGPDVIRCDSAMACVVDSQAVIVALRDPDYCDIPNFVFRGKLVVDCWRLFKDKFGADDGVIYKAVGCTLDGCDKLALYWGRQ
jgi:UDPglucose 6-dehydrogenase